MNHRTKQIALLCFVAGLIALLLLSVSLSDLQFQAGMPFPGSGNTGSTGGNVAPQQQAQPASLPLLEIIFGVALLILVIYLPTRLIRLVSIRNAIRIVAGLLLLLALLSILPRVPPGPPALPPDDSSAPAPARSFDYPVSPLGAPPPAFMWLAGTGLLFGLSLLAVDAWRRKRNPAQAADGLLQPAENALEALRAGKDFPNVIIRCYLEMTEVIRAERNIERHRSMTVREFQDWLEYKGIPPEPVHQLTLLFEKARYSREQMDRKDEKTGEESLRQIVEYCRRENGAG